MKNEMVYGFRSSTSAKLSRPSHFLADGRVGKWRDRSTVAFSISSVVDSLKNKIVKGSQDDSRATLIWRAIKLPIYSVAFVPLTVSFSCIIF